MLHVFLNEIYNESIKKTVAWRNKLISKGKIDPWEGCDGALRIYKPALDFIAKKISNLDPEIIRTRFNPETGKIELYRILSREIVAVVEICGSDDRCHAVVEILQMMPEHLKEFFELILLMRVDFKD